MNSILSQITTDIEPQPPRLVVYGVHGIGKSTFAAWPGCKPIFMNVENGLKTLRVPKLPLVTDWQHVVDQVRALTNEKHDYKTLVIDTLDWVERYLQDFVAKESGKQSVLEIPYGKGYAACRAKMDALLDSLDELNRSRNMMIILTAHTVIKTYSSPQFEPFDRYQLKLNEKISSAVEEWADIIAFVNYKISVKKAEGFKENNRGIGSGERVMYLTEKPAYKAKNRYALPDKMPFDLQQLLQAVYDEERAKKQKADADLPSWI